VGREHEVGGLPGFMVPAPGDPSEIVQTVLIVDDEISMRRALRGFFERAGFAVAEAASADDALRHIREARPADAVVSDVLMPGLGGVDFYDQLRQAAPHLTNRVVFLTGAAGDPKVHAQIEQRGVPLISKLDDLRLVVDAVRLALLKRPSP
jgi:DNA-binding NtrC family response regulator